MELRRNSMAIRECGGGRASGCPPRRSVRLAPEFDSLGQSLLGEEDRRREALYLVRGIIRENGDQWRTDFLRHIANNGILAQLQAGES